MPRINRRTRTLAQPRRSRAQIIELILGPNGKSAFKSESERSEVWELLRLELSDGFASLCWLGQTDPKPFASICEGYARDVVAGKVPACRWVKLACQRHLDDLDRAKGDWPFEFDVSKAERICRFAEMLPHVKGKWAAGNERIRLEPWQIFWLCCLFGWVKKASGLRRFTLAYIEVGRKNAKSILAAIVGLYMFACDGEFGSEVYSGATTEYQAHEVFRPARQMMERSPELREALRIAPPGPNAKRLFIQEDGSRFEPVIGNPGDGAMPSCALVDEYHEHLSDALFDTLQTGMGARTQPLELVITTAGDNSAGPCKLLQDDLCGVLAGLVERPEAFVIIYTIDTKDNWGSAEALIKANPNIGVSVFRDFLETSLRTAKGNARKQAVFKTKHLCVWVGALANYFDVDAWNALGDSSLKIEDFIGHPCVASIDLSTKRDATARAVIFKKQLKGKDHYYVFIRLYLPEQQVMRSEAQHYQGWSEQGFIVVHEGSTVDFDLIAEEAVEVVKRCKAREFAFDPWNAAQFAQAIAKNTKATLVEIDQNVRKLSPPTKELDALIADGRIHHEGNPVLGWMIGNVMAKEDANENVLPRKAPGREEKKIDGAVAVIIALSRVMLAAPKRSVYESRGLLTLPEVRVGA